MNSVRYVMALLPVCQAKEREQGYEENLDYPLLHLGNEGRKPLIHLEHCHDHEQCA